MDSICMPTGCEDIFAERRQRPGLPQWLEAFRYLTNRAPQLTRARPHICVPPSRPRWPCIRPTPERWTAGPAGMSASPRRGFRRTATDGPAPFALVAFPASLRSPARLAAALMPAILAGVPLTGAFCLGGEPTPEVLVTLELAGVEDAFALPAAEFTRLTGELPQCRVVLLHGLDENALPERGDLPGRIWREDALPLFLLPQVYCRGRRAAGLRPRPDCTAQALHGEAARAVLDGGPLPGPCLPAAVLEEDEAARLAWRGEGAPVELLLTPGCEAFWLHPGLTPDFFRCRRRAFSLL